MSAYLLVSLHAQALNNIPDKGLHESSAPVVSKFSEQPLWDEGKGWKNLLNNLRLVLQPYQFFNLLQPWLTVFPISHLSHCNHVDPSRSPSRLERLKPLTSLTPPIAIVVTLIHPRFVYVHSLRQWDSCFFVLGMQRVCLHPVLGSYKSFFSSPANVCQSTRHRAFTHLPLLPQLRHFGLGLVTVPLGKGAKLVLILNAVTMPALVALYSLYTSRGLTAVQPSVNRVAADVEHSANLAFLFATINRSVPQHPTYQALAELGKAVKTIFLCQYLHSEALRQEIHEGLNVVERWNGANNFILYGKSSEIATNSLDEQQVTVLCMHLLQLCLVHINTLMLQRVLSENQWLKMMQPDDFRALTPLIWNHVNPYGLFQLDMNEWLMIEKSSEKLVGV